MTKPITLKTRFNQEIVPELQKTLNIKNRMAVPKVTKVKINVGIGTYLKKHKEHTHITENLEKISGQKPILTKSKKAISNFKIREDMVIGIAVTMREKRMYDFLNKLVNIVFPRVRDFRGIAKTSFDGNGNFSIGFKEHTVFPEISPDDVINLHGLQISITTSAKNDKEGYELLKAMGFPFKKEVSVPKNNNAK
ncbi:MAG: 50S ribosomal protein L5 [Candidatus Peregrinibacteria bacterium]